MLPQGVAGQSGIRGGPYLKYFGGALNGQRVPLGMAMIDPMGIRQAILELGLEDLIPLPEMVTSQEIRSACGEDISIGPLRTALICLLREDRIQIWSGHWSQDPQVVDSAVAESLLLIDEQYIFNSSSDRRIRVYYANVDNIRA